MRVEAVDAKPDISVREGEFDRVDFWILDSLSDDYESILQILPRVRDEVPEITAEQILDHIADLIEHRYVRLRDELIFSKYVILMDLKAYNYEHSDYRFGMTPGGCDLWQKLAGDFGYEQVDWNDMWGSYVDYEARKGYAVGPSLERCQEVLNKLHLDGPEFMIDRASFRVSRVDVWRPKY